MITGNWLGYLTRTGQQFIDGLMARLPSDLPEITDYSRNNPFIFRLLVWGNILENLQYYIDRKARNNFISVSTVWESYYYHAERMDYRIKGATASSVDLVFSLDANAVSDVLIPEGTQISSRSGILFFTSEDATIVTGTDSIQVSALQAEVIPNINVGQTDGTERQKIEIEEDKIVDELVSVTIDSIPYTSVDTFAYSVSTDRNYRFSKSLLQNFELLFGDGTNGIIPPSGQDVIVTYRITEGVNGNVQAGEIVNIDDTITVGGGLELSVINPNASSGGTDSDDIQTLRSKIPQHRVTLEKAVTEQDHSRIALQVAGVGDAGVLVRECHKVELYVSPIGGGIASQVLRDSVDSFFDDKKMIGKEITVLSAGILELSISINLNVIAGFPREDAKQNVRNSLVALSDLSTNSVGDNVSIGDIYEAIENSQGVVNSEIVKFTTIPYAFPIDHENQLSWSRTVQPSVDIYSKWTIKIQSATIFEIFKDDSFVGLGTIGSKITFDEVIFTISSGGYTIGNTWEFNIYPYNKSIESREASKLSIQASNINFNSVKGGV